jgi:chemotaxis response regulator CheB
MLRPRVLVIDDSLTIRAMFEELLLADPELKLVGLAESAEEALAMIDQVLPDVIAVDLHLPGLNGMDFLDRIKDHWRPMSAVLVSSSATHKSDICKEAFARGAVACFDKSKLIANGAKLCQLLKEAAKGSFNHASYRTCGTTLPTKADAAPAAPDAEAA